MVNFELLNDQDIRTYLLSNFVRQFRGQSDTLLVQEMGLCRGQSRIDLAIINGIIHGIEIKSDLDTIERLERQVEIYGKILDKVTLYVGNKLIDSALKVIPSWWGVVLIYKNQSGEINLRNLRKPRMNKYQDSFEILQLLWKEEALQLIDEIGMHGKYTNKSRDIIFASIEQCLSLKKIREYTRKILKKRDDWQTVHSLT